MRDSTSSMSSGMPTRRMAFDPAAGTTFTSTTSPVVSLIMLGIASRNAEATRSASAKVSGRTRTVGSPTGEPDSSSARTSCSAIGMTASGAETISVFVFRSAVTVRSRSTPRIPPGTSSWILATRISRSIGASESARALASRKVRSVVAGTTGPDWREAITESTRSKIETGPDTISVSLATSIATVMELAASVIPR